MHMKLWRPAMVAVALACAAPLKTARADDNVKTAGRAVFETAQKSVVTVKLVVKIKIVGPGGGRDQEQKVEVSGTVIDPSGLTVVSASAIDPTAMLKQLFKAMMPGAGEDAGPKIDSDVTETNLVLEDGTEIESDVVLKDQELDLAFVRPRDAAKKKFEAIALKARASAPQVLDDVICVSRLGRSANRAPAVTLSTIKAVVKGPKTYYICTAEGAENLGCIAYGIDHEPLGIFVTKMSKDVAGEGELGMMSMMMGGGAKPAMTILRPIADLLELAEQAKNAKAPEKKKKDKDDDEDDAPPKKIEKKDGKKAEDGGAKTEKKDEKKKSKDDDE